MQNAGTQFGQIRGEFAECNLQNGLFQLHFYQQMVGLVADQAFDVKNAKNTGQVARYETV